MLLTFLDSEQRMYWFNIYVLFVVLDDIYYDWEKVLIVNIGRVVSGEN